jgi:homoserine O-succinyltransferase
MPLIAHSNLPTFARLAREGYTVLKPERAAHQDIRELHVGLLNMMPDAALQATERQFLRLVGEASPVAQIHAHPFTFPQLPRSAKALRHIEAHYESFDNLQEKGLDALIITGANVTEPDMSAEPFWEPLRDVIEWAAENVTSTFCSCLATHAVMEFRYGQPRYGLSHKRWGVFPHRVVFRTHPFVHDANTRFDVPHSRFNEVSRAQFDAAGLHVLVESDTAGVHLATSEDGLRLVLSQGHQEYDTISLLKEYRREVSRFAAGELAEYPPQPDGYFAAHHGPHLSAYEEEVKRGRLQGGAVPPFPEAEIVPTLDNTWRDTAERVVGNWIGAVYQVTHQDRRLPFMDDIDPADPLGIR